MGEAFSLDECTDGTVMVIDTRTMRIMAHFRCDMREFAEEMRDRLNVRMLVREAR